MKRESMCRVSYCPEPRNPDWHSCIKCESPYIEHHHANGRGGMGGSKRLREDKSGIVALCHFHHEEAHGIRASTGEGEEPGILVQEARSSLPSPAGALQRTPERGEEDSHPFSMSGNTSPQLDAGGRDSRVYAPPKSLPAAVTPPSVYPHAQTRSEY